MPLLKSDVERVARRIREEVDLDVAWPGGYPDEAEAALVDAVLSIRARYGTPDSGVRKRVSDYRSARGGGPVDDLRAMADQLPLLESLTSQRLPGGLVKGQAIHRAAQRLVEAGFTNAADLRDATRDPKKAKSAYVGVTGLGVVTFDYFLMLLGRPGIKADTHIVAFVSHALGDRRTSSAEARSLLVEVSSDMGTDATQLDHAIWHHQRSG